MARTTGRNSAMKAAANPLDEVIDLEELVRASRPPMAIGYARVSSPGDRQSLDLQIDALVAAGVDPAAIFKDHMTGERNDRPGLVAALAFLKAGDTLVVWKLDRLSRRLRFLIDTVADLAKTQVAFRSLTENMDTTRPEGALLFQVMGSLAEFQNAQTRERVQAGVEAAARRGRVGGRPRACSEATLELIKAALATSGKTQAQVAAAFGLKRTTLTNILRRDKREAHAKA